MSESLVILPESPENIRVINQGEPNGQDWAFRITSSSGRDVLAVAVSPVNNSRTGPTWSYVFEAEGLTSVDLGTPNSFTNLEKAYSNAGVSISEIETLSSLKSSLYSSIKFFNVSIYLFCFICFKKLDFIIMKKYIQIQYTWK